MATSTTPRIRLEEAVEYMAQHQDFIASTMSGKSVARSASIQYDRLPSALVKELDRYRDHNSSKLVFIVWSFQTPIAWHAEGDEPIVPDVHYSSRTSRHQNLVARAWLHEEHTIDCPRNGCTVHPRPGRH